MQLRIARLCLDCEEVHDAAQCPVCASEVFAYLTRWVPAPEGRLRPKPTPPPDYEVYREITAAEEAPRPKGRLMLRSLLGLGVLGAAGLAWQKRSKGGASSPAEPGTRPPARPAGD